MEEKNLIELLKVSLDKSNDSNNKDDEPILYYDRYSKNIFDLDQNGIRVYNRKANKEDKLKMDKILKYLTIYQIKIN